MEGKIIMTNLTTESIINTLDGIMAKMNEETFPYQQNKLFQHMGNQRLILAILQICINTLSQKMNKNLENIILLPEDYNVLRECFQAQKSLVTLEIQEILKVLYKKRRKMDRVNRLSILIVNNEQFGKSYASKICDAKQMSTKEEFDNYLYHTHFSAYNDWLAKNYAQEALYPLNYSIYYDLDYDSYFHIACMAQETKRVKKETMTPEKFAESKNLPEDITLITAYVNKKYLKNLSISQLQSVRETLKLALKHLISMRSLRGREFTQEITEYWDCMDWIEKEQQKRGKSL